MSFIFVPSTGGGPSSGLTVENAAGATLGTGDILKGNAPTSGATTGFAQLDASGDFVGTWIPRAGTYSSLLALTNDDSEICQATDIPGLVLLNQTAGATGIFPWATPLDVPVAGAGAVAATLATNAARLLVAIGSGVTSFVGTLAAGSIDGQTLEVQIADTPAGMGAISINGTTIADSTGTASGYLSPSIPGTNGPLSCSFQWNATADAWQLTNLGPVPTELQTFPYGITIPPAPAGTAITSWVASGVLAVAIGPNSIYANGNVAAGYHNAIPSSLPRGAFSIGATNQIFYSGVGIGVNAKVYGGSAGATAIGGISPAAGGSGSLALAGGKTGAAAAAGFIAATSIALVSGTTYQLQVPSTAGIENGVTVIVQLGGAGGLCVRGTVASLVPNTSFNITITAANAALATLIIPAWLTNNLTQYVNVSSGQGAIATGSDALAYNKNDEETSTALIAAPGDNQSGRCRLIGSTTTNAAVTLSLDGNAANANTTIGQSNRFIPATGQAILLLMKLVGQDQASGGGMFSALRQVAVQNSGGVLSVTQAPVLLGADLATGTLASLTFAGDVAVSANGTYESLDVAVTGLAATTIHWACELSRLELI